MLPGKRNAKRLLDGEQSELMQTSIAGKASNAERTIRCITERSRSISEPCSGRPVAVLSPVPVRLCDRNMLLFHKSAAGALILGTDLVRSQSVSPDEIMRPERP